VIWAFDRASQQSTAILEKEAASVSAHIMEGSKYTAPIAKHSYRLVPDLGSQIAARQGEYFAAAETEPGLGEDLINLDFKDMGVAVVVAREGMRCTFLGWDSFDTHLGHIP
jgi:hypothetical protein